MNRHQWVRLAFLGVLVVLSGCSQPDHPAAEDFIPICRPRSGPYDGWSVRTVEKNFTVQLPPQFSPVPRPEPCFERCPDKYTDGRYTVTLWEGSFLRQNLGRVQVLCRGTTSGLRMELVADAEAERRYLLAWFNAGWSDIPVIQVEPLDQEGIELLRSVASSLKWKSTKLYL